MTQFTKVKFVEVLDAAWRALVRFHADQVGAAGDQPDDEGPAAGQDKGGKTDIDDMTAGLTEDSLYGGGEGEGEGEDEDGADPDKGGKARPKTRAKTGEEGGEGEGEGGKPGPKGGWDKDRQRRDQEHAAERRALVEQLHVSQETNQRLLERLEASAAPKKGTEADADLAELEAAIDAHAKIAEGLSDDSDPSALIQAHRESARASRAILAAMKKVRASSGASPELTALQEKLADQARQLEELQGGQEQRAATDAAKERKKAYDVTLADCQKKYGAQHTAKAVAAAQKFFMDRGFDPERPETWPTQAEEELALRYAFLTAGAAKPRRADEDVTLDNPRGGASLRTGRKTGSLIQVLDRMKRAGKLR